VPIVSTKPKKLEELTEPLLQASFPVSPGRTIASNHGYALYSALKRYQPWIEKCPHTLINTISGLLNRQGGIETQEFSRLLIRTPISKASCLYALAGQDLTIGQGKISLGVPTIAPLNPKPFLRARIVIIHLKGSEQDSYRREVPPDRFLIAATERLKTMGCSSGKLSLSVEKGKLARRVLVICKDRKATIPGYGVEISGLTNEDSLLLQQVGFGSKNKMGGGFLL
jgi:CRISPR-associated protein Cas6